MCPGKNREPDDVHIFLEGGINDHLWSLAQASVDDLHAGVAQGARYDLGAAVVPIQSRLGNQHADFLLSHRLHLTTEGTEEHRGEEGRR